VPFPVFILIAALLVCLIVLALLAVLNRAFDLADRRWNGMHLYFGLQIYPRDTVE